MATKRLRVVHFPQIGTLKKSFSFEVKDESHAYVLWAALIQQHLWLYKNKVIPDYSNACFVEMYDEEINTETNKPYGWCDYISEDGEDWDTYVASTLKDTNPDNFNKIIQIW